MTETPHTGKRPPTQTLPKEVKEFTVRRNDYSDTLYVAMKGDMWRIDFTTTDAEMLTRIHEIAAAMEAVK